MHDDRLAIRTGFAVLAAAVLAAVLVMTLGDVRWGKRIAVRVYFEHNAALTGGTDVQVAGRVIGEIDSIRFLRADEAGRPAAAGANVVADVRIDADSVHLVPINGEWFVSSKGLFGERYLEVGPPPGHAAWDRAIADGDELRGIDPPQIDRLAAISLENITAMRTLTRELLPEWQELSHELDALSATLDTLAPEPADLGRMWAAQRELLDEARATLDAWDKTGTSADDIGAVAARATRTFHRARAQIESIRVRLDRLVAELERVRGRIDPARLDRFREAMAHVDRILARVDETLATAEELTAFVAQGRGTVGGFLTDHELVDFAKMMNKNMKRQPWELMGTQRP